jgi:hypothetical protein
MFPGLMKKKDFHQLRSPATQRKKKTKVQFFTGERRLFKKSKFLYGFQI